MNNKLIQKTSSAISRMPTQLLIAGTVMALSLIGADVHAQAEFTMPQVNIEGVDEGTSGDGIVVAIFKYIGMIVLWLLMGIAGIIGVKNIAKSWNAAKQNDEGRWGAVAGDVIGNTIMVIAVIALGTWVSGFLA